MNNPERRNHWTREELVARARSEFADMPGLRITREQASKLWSLRPDISERILGQLEQDGVLRRADRGNYCRRDVGA